MIRRGGCWALLFLAAAPLMAQLSPGKLSRAHAALEGSVYCLKCHQPGKGVAPARCLDCHTALEARIAARRGLHARPGHARCETCHNEHHGREFQLVFWGKGGPASFDHGTTGFRLAGAHARLACRSCHRPERVRGAARQGGGANPARTFLGLSPSCLSCHHDEHRGQAGPTCLSCHTMESWRPAPGFDHARTSFPLTGRHQAVACMSCHPRRSDALAGDRDRQFLVFSTGKQGCAGCHRDPHQGRFGANCQSCHATTGWKSQGTMAGFDHARTGFPLTGRHREVACASCHRSRDRAGATVFTRMAHGRCTDCHQDPHQGRLGTTCQQCHSTGGWKAARTGFDHERTRFPLRGAHREVACQECHRPGEPLRRGRFERCADCHRDPHLGQLAARLVRTGGAAGPPATPANTACEACHTVAGFSPSTFTVADHQKGAYPLRAAHLAVPCNSCHRPVAVAALPPAVLARLPPEARGRQARAVQFRFASTACRTCHGDPHGGEVDRFVAAGGCETCHSLEGWRRVIFDHDRTAFPLEGGHQGVACRSCHAPAGEGAGRGAPADRLRDRLHFGGVPTACATCHGDPHEGQLARSSPPLACAQCHSVLAWSRVSFDHDRRSRFKLEGAHRALPCAACHRREVRDGRSFVRFKPLPVACEGCHGGQGVEDTRTRRRG